MRADRGWRKFYGAGWLISAGVMLDEIAAAMVLSPATAKPTSAGQ